MGMGLVLCVSAPAQSGTQNITDHTQITWSGPIISQTIFVFVGRIVVAEADKIQRRIMSADINRVTMANGIRTPNPLHDAKIATPVTPATPTQPVDMWRQTMIGDMLFDAEARQM